MSAAGARAAAPARVPARKRATVAPAPKPKAPPRRRPRGKAAPTPKPSPVPLHVQRRRARRGSSVGLRNGVTWIGFVALLLGGVVALNVAVLQLNIRLDRLAHEQTNLRAGNAALSAQLSSAGAPPHVVSVAHRKLGLVPASPEQTTYVPLPGP